MYDRYSQNSGLYAADQNYAYYGQYSIPITICITYDFDSTKSQQEKEEFINNVIKIHYNEEIVKCGNLQFEIDYNPDFGSDTIEFELKSSQKFFDTINNFDTDDIKNVYIKTGQTQDSSGETLKTNQIY